MYNFLDGGLGYDYNDNNDMEPIRITKIIRTGTSLCVVVPKEVLRAHKLERGDQVILRPLSENAFMVSKITSEEISKLNLPSI